MMTTETLKPFMDLLVTLDCQIAEKTITVEHLKSLILIMYNEVLIKETPNTMIKDYLTLVVKHFIDLENEAQLLATKQKDDALIDITSSFVHRKLTNQTDDDEDRVEW